MRFATPAFAAAVALLAATAARGAEVLPPVTERFADKGVEETPDFQRHVVPLFGRLGCNGRACHGSFQGRGGFQLSLFGYDFKSDHEALFDEDSPRVDKDEPQESLIIYKPTDEDVHEGGKRYDVGGWEHKLLSNWIENGAKYDSVQKLVKLQVEPSALQFAKADEKVQLKVIAHWKDGTKEDVTPLCRFRSNNSENAKIDQDGIVTSNKPGDTHVVVFYDKAVIPVPVIRPVSDKYGKNYPKIASSTKVDGLVIDKLSKLGLVPSDTCSDAEFLRRVRLDLTGTLPTSGEVKAFLADKSSEKRAKKIDELLESDEYAAWWTTKLCDFTGNNEQQLNNIAPGANRGRPGSDWYNWIQKRVKENTPYDELAAGMITAVSRPEGMEYREYCEKMSNVYRSDSELSFEDLDGMTYYWARRDLRQPPERAIAFAYSFMGVRIQCAQCHKHPFDQWSKQDFEDFSKFFSSAVFAQNGRDRKEYQKMIKELGLGGERGGQLRRKLGPLLEEGKTIPFPELYVRPTKGKARLLGGDEIDLAEVDDPREVVMDWLRQPDNRFFATAFVNRVWASYFKVGIVDPPDDLSLANPPSNKPLLDHLAKGFVENGFDMKWVHREILNSDTYQRSWRPNETNGADERNFSRMAVRRLPAEVVYDAVRQATLADPRVGEMFEDLSQRAICVPSSGQRNRNGANYALTIFGRSTRESNCDCDRSESPSLLQTVYLQNDSELLGMVSGARDEGWIEQIEAQYGLKATGTNRLEAARQQLQRLKQQMAQLKKRGANKQQQQRIKQAYAAASKRVRQFEKLAKGQKKGFEYEEKEYDPQEIVQEAYLRTLSRYPTDDELKTSVAYIEEAETKTQGVRDVLWALVNTKEFIVNH